MFARLGLLAAMLFCVNGCASVVSATTGGEGVQENRGVRSMGSMIDDGSIATAVEVNLDAADDGLRNAHINVISFNGVVLLVGQVPSQDLKNLATRVATNTNSRIKEVHNELEIGGAISFLARSNDAWLTTKLKTLMLADPTVAGLRTKVVTENGVVYLMGLVSQREAQQAIELVSGSQGVTKVVSAFEYIN
ncbi:MAG TPA: BON domain-containing protein [Hyphomicrobiales bacterium]|nr:BON domain-containing protein [Hyphomicrobiales bacterium]